jgi:hypothetical protein
VWSSFGSSASGGDAWDLTGYFVVEIDGVYYISQTSFDMSGDGSYSLSAAGLSSESWAVYTPSASLDFDQSTAVYSSLDLDNVTAVGIYYEDDLWSGGTNAAAYGVGISSLTASGTIPEPAHMSMLLGLICLLAYGRSRATSHHRE